jgi:hypothetical protein
MINKKQKKAIKSPYLGTFCRKERSDIVVMEWDIYIIKI